MMKINAKSWVSIATNISIVGGLLLVGAQMKQEANLLRLQMLSEEIREMVETERVMLGENAAAVWAKSLQSPHDLSLEERRIMDAYLYIFAEHLRSIYLLAQEGLVENTEWQTRVAIDAGYFFGNPYGQAWWRNFSRQPTTYPQDLINVINEKLNGNVENTMQYFDGILEFLPEKPGADSNSELPQ
jgi:hypothetical protein